MLLEGKIVSARRRNQHARRMRYPIYFALVLAAGPASLPAEISVSDCERAAKYSESRRGSAVLVMQNGRTIFERYANDGSANTR